MAEPAIVEHLRPFTKAKLDHLIATMDGEDAEALLSDWGLWALPYQQLPPGEWRRWLLRCGRGAGKTHTGARTTNEVARDIDKIGRGEIGIIGSTYGAARFTMVEGPSGILASAPPDFRPEWQPGNMMLKWPNGVKARAFSADKLERGPNWSWVWADEPAHWPDLEGTWWAIVEPALRLGWSRGMLTTTPVRDPALRSIEDDEDTVTTRASTYDNPYLKEKLKEIYRRRFEGTKIGRVELNGDYPEFSEFALWDPDMIDAFRARVAPLPFLRVVIGVDPAVTAKRKSNSTGIIVAGLGDDGHAYIVQDRTIKGSPQQWGRRVVAAYHRWDADCVVAEVNNGGDLVESNITTIDKRVNVKSVRASRGKVVRAEPIVALYEKGMVHHVGGLADLEDQMVTWEPVSAKESPDRVDALVWALWELFLADDHIGSPRAYL